MFRPKDSEVERGSTRKNTGPDEPFTDSKMGSVSFGLFSWQQGSSPTFFRMLPDRVIGKRKDVNWSFEFVIAQRCDVVHLHCGVNRFRLVKRPVDRGGKPV